MDGPDAFPLRPRAPTWRASLRERWPVGALGLALVASGGLLSLSGWLDPSASDMLLGLVLLPGVGVVMLWMRFLFRYRVLLTHAEIAQASPGESGDLRFYDSDGVAHQTGIHAADHTALGAAFIAYDRDDPRFHRRVRPEDFRS